MSPFDLEILARTIYGEARGEPDTGKLWVAWSIANRFHSGKWFAGRTIASTCTKDRQYSSWNHGPDNAANRDALMNVADSDAVFATCLSAAQATAGTDCTGGATHYYADTIAEPSWVAGATFCGKQGHHLFYRDVK